MCSVCMRSVCVLVYLYEYMYTYTYTYTYTYRYMLTLRSKGGGSMNLLPMDSEMKCYKRGVYVCRRGVM
jgi:hypothetical protein